MLGHITLARSEEYLKLQSVQQIPVVPKDDGDTIFKEYFPQTIHVDPNAQLNPAALAKEEGLTSTALFLGWLTCLLKFEDLSLDSV